MSKDRTNSINLLPKLDAMNIESYREYCLSLPAVTEDTPFDQTTLAFRVGGKIFCLCDIESFEFINLKCDPLRAIELREQYPGIRPGYHMNKKHWNSVYTDGSISDQLIQELTVHSYELIRDSLPKNVRKEIEESSAS
jgi:predicted DNA-binding protein (MmcQ/YjbR family)